MLAWKIVLQVVCVVILTVLVFFFVVPYIMEAIDFILPQMIFELKEEIRCHLFQRHGICLSLYPNPVREGETVEVAFRGRRWWEGDKVCVADDETKEAVGDCCTLTDGRCSTNFIATSREMTGWYFAFIDNVVEDEKWQEVETKGEEKELTVNPTS